MVVPLPMPHRPRWLLALVLWLVALPGQAIQEIRIGVLSHRGSDLTLEHWQPTADYLTQALEGYRFEILPLPFGRISEFVEMEFVDFILVNPGIYVDLEVRFGIARLATLNNRVGDLSLNHFSSVIFTRHDREDIQSLGDLKGKSFLAVDETSLGGFEMTWDELLRQGLDPYRDFRTLGFAGDHDSVVLAVGRGEVDAGTVRTNILERMATRGLSTWRSTRSSTPSPPTAFRWSTAPGSIPSGPSAGSATPPTTWLSGSPWPCSTCRLTTRRPWPANMPAGRCPWITSRCMTSSAGSSFPPTIRASPITMSSSAIPSGWRPFSPSCCSSPPWRTASMASIASSRAPSRAWRPSTC